MKPQSFLNFTTFRLSTNATKYIFPIREQKILLKKPGKGGKFAQARVIIKLEDLSQIATSLEPAATPTQRQNIHKDTQIQIAEPEPRASSLSESPST